MKISTLLLITFFVFYELASSQWKPGENIIDERDGQSYKTVKIGTQVWMAENLNIGTAIKSTQGGGLMSNNGIIEKYCWDDDIGNCDGTGEKIKRGGFYEWEEAVQYWNGQPSLPVRGICPKGWHIPSQQEWVDIITYLGGTDAAMKKLQVGGGSGFDAILTGYRCTMTGGFRISAMSSDIRTYFWTAEETDAQNAPLLELGANSFTSFAFLKSLGLCVRCLWDGQSSTEPEIKTDNVDLDFGDILVGKSIDLQLVIENSGGNDLIISDLSIKDDLSSVFKLSIPTLPIKINPKSKITVSVTFSPDESGDFNANLLINSNAYNLPEHNIHILGKAHIGKPHIYCSKSKLLFAKVQVGSEKSLQLPIENMGESALNISSYSMANNDLNVFEVGDIQLPVSIEPAGVLDLNVIFKPAEGIKYTSTLKIFSDSDVDSELAIDLVGTGGATSDISGGDSEQGPHFTLDVSPIPSNKSAVISYTVNSTKPEAIQIKIVDINGSHIETLHEGIVVRGEYSLELPFNKFPSGSYFIILSNWRSQIKRPLIIVK